MPNDTQVRTIKPCKRPVKLSDSGGLYLLIAPAAPGVESSA
jgi:hypothetical protein